MKTYKIHFIRHGITKDNIEGIYCGITDTPLCDEGKEQLMKMKEEYLYPDTQFIFTSPLTRCKETAEILYPNLKPIVIEDLTEYNFGEFEGKTAEELQKKQPNFEPWLKGEPGVRPPFGESNEDFAKRVCNCFVKIVDGVIKTGTEDLVIVTHGGVISTILSNFGLPEASVSDWLTPPGCGYTVRVSHFLWMQGHKFEVIKEIPEISPEETQGNYYDGWDYYPNDDDFDVSEYLYD